jgi:hypothetical protein
VTSIKRIANLALALALTGCGGSSADDDGGGGSAAGDLLGTFAVQLVAPRVENDGTTTPGYTSVLGKVYDGVNPEAVIWDTTMTDGGCRLQVPRVPFCSPSCGSNMVCVDTNTCASYPTSQSVGSVRVEGLHTSSGATGVDLIAVANAYQAPASAGLSYPGFAAGDKLELTASGSAFSGAFSITTSGVTQLALDHADSLALAASTALALGWTAGASDAQIHIALDISHHGGSKGKIECDAADRGALTLSSAMVDQLLSLGVAGFPTIVVTRSVTGHAAVADGHVDLVASSQLEVSIGVPGVKSCVDDTQCTPPATCQDDLTCR